MGLAETLTVVFVVLKLIGVIAWSWWWIFSPMWIFYGLLVAVFLILFVGFLFVYWNEKLHKKKGE